LFSLLKTKPREMWFQIKVLVLKTLKNEVRVMPALTFRNSAFFRKRFWRYWHKRPLFS